MKSLSRKQQVSSELFKGKVMKKSAPRTNRLIDNMILTIRGQKVILDHDLAALYGVPTFRFNEAVKRNRKRFPDDFMFQLTTEELAALTSQIAMSKIGRGGRRTPTLRVHGTRCRHGCQHSSQRKGHSNECLCRARVREDARPDHDAKRLG